MAEKLANREQLLLYLRIGKMIHEKIEKANWGAKILDKISVDLQQELPGIRGFSAVNLKRMRVFFREWDPYLQIGSTVLNQLQNSKNKTIIFSSAVPNQIQQKGKQLNNFEMPDKYRNVLPNIDDLKKIM